MEDERVTQLALPTLLDKVEGIDNRVFALEDVLTGGRAGEVDLLQVVDTVSGMMDRIAELEAQVEGMKTVIDDHLQYHINHSTEDVVEGEVLSDRETLFMVDDDDNDTYMVKDNSLTVAAAKKSRIYFMNDTPQEVAAFYKDVYGTTEDIVYRRLRNKEIPHFVAGSRSYLMSIPLIEDFNLGERLKSKATRKKDTKYTER